MNERMVASPYATGGGGTVFEMKVQASLVALLLVRGHVPVFKNAHIREIHLQTGYKGVETDDVLVITLDNSGKSSRQLWSIKSGIKFTESNSDFQQVIEDAWTDFNNPEKFDRDNDVFIIATSMISDKNRHLTNLLETSRVASSLENFQQRMGYISKEAKDYFSVIHCLCSKSAHREVSDLELWEFIRCFHILNFDFNQIAGQYETNIKTMLSMALRNEAQMTSGELWNGILAFVSEKNPRAGIITYENLPENWKNETKRIGAYFDNGAITRLLEHGKNIANRIKTSLGPAKLQVPRQKLISELCVDFVNQHFTLLSGEPGAGKSAAAIMALEKITEENPLFIFQATDFAYDNLDQAFSQLRITETLSQISALFALHQRKFILIESAEKLLERSQREAFHLFFTQLAKDQTWRVVITCREQSFLTVKDDFFAPPNFNGIVKNVEIPLLNDEELAFVLKHKQKFQKIASDHRTRKLLRNLFYLDQVLNAGLDEENIESMTDIFQLRKILWKQTIAKDNCQQGGIHRLREKCFIDIALKSTRLNKQFVKIPENNGIQMALQSLIMDGLLIEDSDRRLVALSHDIFLDWAMTKWFSGKFYDHGNDPKTFFDSIGDLQTARRIYREWLQELLASENSNDIRKFTDSIFLMPSDFNYWNDTIISILLSDEAPDFIKKYEKNLLADNKILLKKIINLLHIGCRKPNLIMGLSEEALGKVFGDKHFVPDGKGWGAVIRLVHRNIKDFDFSDDLFQVLKLLLDWKPCVTYQTPLPDAAREAGLIALHYWQNIGDDYNYRNELEQLSSILVTLPQAIKEEFENLLKVKEEGQGRNYHIEFLERKLLASPECCAACSYVPRAVADFILDRLGVNATSYKKPRWSSIIDKNFGLKDYHHIGYTVPPCAIKGPFLNLLSSAQEIGIDSIVKLVNFATKRYVEIGAIDNDDKPVEIEIRFKDGSTCKQWANDRLWLLYRNAKPGPNILICALMALEYWLLGLAEKGQDLSDITKTLILKSNSIAITSIVNSIRVRIRNLFNMI